MTYYFCDKFRINDKKIWLLQWGQDFIQSDQQALKHARLSIFLQCHRDTNFQHLIHLEFSGERFSGGSVRDNQKKSPDLIQEPSISLIRIFLPVKYLYDVYESDWLDGAIVGVSSNSFCCLECIKMVPIFMALNVS